MPLPDDMRAKLEAGQAATATALRTLADRIDALPLSDAGGALLWIGPHVETLHRQAELAVIKLPAKASHSIDRVLGQALTGCTSCHAPGLQAQATRLHVLRTGPLATARAVAQLIDSASPASSRILQKPLNLVPHEGGPQLVAGSAPEQILEQWVAMVAQAHCN
jgi:hypothetical protein